MKFAALGVMDVYKVTGGITHSFLNLAFPGYEWSISRPGLFYSWTRNRIYLEEEIEWNWRFGRSEMSRVPAEIQTPNRPALSLVTIHTELYRSFFGEGLAKTTNSRRTCADLCRARYGCQTRCIKLFSVMRPTDVVFVFSEPEAVYTCSDTHSQYGDEIDLFYFLRKGRRFI